MKRNLLCVGIGLGILAMASMALAGDFHTGVSLNCQDCHVMHYSQTHGYNGDGSGNFTDLGGAGPYGYLLRNDINNLCLSCHDGSSFAPDVLEAHSNGYVRQAGALNMDGVAPYQVENGHTLGSTDVAPGGTFANAEGLSCTDCHAAHGSNPSFISSYRNLGGYGTAAYLGAISYTSVTNDLSAWVHEDANGGTNASHYGVGAITFNEPDIAKSGYADFCKSCHTDFHGDVGGTEIEGTTAAGHFIRHPAGGVDVGAIGGGHSSMGRVTGRANQTQMMSPTGQKAGGYDGTDTGLTPSCFSCHKGHGNQNAFGLIYMLGTGVIDEEGDDGIDARNTCRQCHGMGGSSTAF